MVVTFIKETGEIVGTEDYRITSVFDSPEWRDDLEEQGLGWMGIPYELGAAALGYKVVVNEKGEGIGFVANNNEEGDA